jgi:hypothetical protein
MMGDNGDRPNQRTNERREATDVRMARKTLLYGNWQSVDDNGRCPWQQHSVIIMVAVLFRRERSRLLLRGQGSDYRR